MYKIALYIQPASFDVSSARMELVAWEHGHWIMPAHCRTTDAKTPLRIWWHWPGGTRIDIDAYSLLDGERDVFDDSPKRYLHRPYGKPRLALKLTLNRFGTLEANPDKDTCGGKRIWAQPIPSMDFIIRSVMEHSTIHKSWCSWAT